MKPLLAIFSAITLLSFSSSCGALAQNSNDEDEPNIKDLLNMTEVSGTYVNDDAGVFMRFPEGWKGFSFMGFPFIAPGGFNLMNQDETTAMAVLALDRSEMEMDAGVEGDFMTGDGIPTLQPKEEGCTTISTSYRTVNSMTALNAISECEKEGSYAKANVYAFASKTHFVEIVFSAPSTALYDKYVGEFEESVKTLRLSNPVNIKTAFSEAMGLKAEVQKISVKGKQTDVRIETNSQLSNFVFDEQAKRASFRVEGQDGTRGSATIAISSFLEGPYTVMVDGSRTSDAFEIRDENTGTVALQINYGHSVHDIVVTGTNVVPEFPLHIVFLLGATIGIVVFITRPKMLNL